MSGFIEQVLSELRSLPGYRGQILSVSELPARPGRVGEEIPLSPRVSAVLQGRGIKRLWTHQVEAIGAVRRGESVAIAAGTASGKTLCFLIPIAEELERNPRARALLLYPTKALAQDQLRKLEEFGAGELFEAHTYDGDTPQPRRRFIRRSAHVVLSNPDMLHLGILPYHHLWVDFFRNLRFVVIDEMHVYAGVFGSHTANVLRRLRRICRHYGSSPQFICCSATIGNPGELAEQLTGLRHRVVADDGSPQGRRALVMWNPPLIHPRVGHRRSANMEAAELLAFMARRGIRTIVFTLARRQAELIVRYAREKLGSHSAAERIMAYRGGYLPEERRAIERALFEGKLIGVVATSALELGIDIGDIQVVIMAGYPGRNSSLWQRAGRAGRRQEESLAILVALPTSIDQYVVSHPEWVLDNANERIFINPSNPYILAAHLMCAAYEQPIDPAELELFGESAEDLLGLLAEKGFVIKRHRWHWIDPTHFPASMISIRSASGAGYDIYVRTEAGQLELLGTIDDRSAFWMVHPGAVYLHGGETYVVLELDVDGRRVIVAPADVNYYTEAISVSDISIEEPDAERQAGGVRWCAGWVSVAWRVVAFRRREQVTERELDTIPLDLPEQRYRTTGMWIVLGEGEVALIERAGHHLMGSIHALEHAVVNLLPLFAQCDPRDVGGASYAYHPDTMAPTIFIHDAYPGGVGISRSLFGRLGEVLAAVADRIAGCPCEEGCPQCVQNPSCGDNNQPLDKAGALVLARHLAAAVAGAAHGRVTASEDKGSDS